MAWPDDLDPLEVALLHRFGACDASRPDDDTTTSDVDPLTIATLLEAQVTSRLLDHTARWLRAEHGLGYYTIGSAGHEANATVALALRPTDPALLHYRSGGFYVARSMQARAAGIGGGDPIVDVLRGMLARSTDQIAGGRHKVFGNRALSIIPQTSTIASHLPRAVGLALSLDPAFGTTLRREPPDTHRRAVAASWLDDADSPTSNDGVDVAQPSRTWPADAVVVCSFGDASLNHSTAQGALNWAGHAARAGQRVPIVFVCEDNRIGLSVATPGGWVESSTAGRAGVRTIRVDGADPVTTLRAVGDLVADVRVTGRPGLVHLDTVRFLGHAGTDVESAYRTPAELADDRAHDPIVGTARVAIAQGTCSADELAEWYLDLRSTIRSAALAVSDEPELTTADEVMEPLTSIRPTPHARGDSTATVRSHPLRPPDPGDLHHRSKRPVLGPPVRRSATDAARPSSPTTRTGASGSERPEHHTSEGSERSDGSHGSEAHGATEPTPRPTGTPNGTEPTLPATESPGRDERSTLARTINRALADLLDADPALVVFGEDVGRKGGVYGVTRGLRQRAGEHRVFDTLLDEQSVLGLALGSSLNGFLPVPEIQYLAYLHNAEDQLRGEAATLGFFSMHQYANPMVVRIASYAYQKGFGGHFHNDDSIAVLRDVPGLVIASPGHPSDAAGMLIACVEHARSRGAVCVFLEPIARYHDADLHAEHDGGWSAPYDPTPVPIGRARTWGDGTDLTIVTWANGLYLSRRAQKRLADEHGIDARVVDLRWIAPLPLDDLVGEAEATGRVLVVDETRRSGGVGEGIVAELVHAGFDGAIRRIAARDSFVPLGAAAELVLVSEDDVVDAALASTGRSG